MHNKEILYVIIYKFKLKICLGFLQSTIFFFFMFRSPDHAHKRKKMSHSWIKSRLPWVIGSAGYIHFSLMVVRGKIACITLQWFTMLRRAYLLPTRQESDSNGRVFHAYLYSYKMHCISIKLHCSPQWYAAGHYSVYFHSEKPNQKQKRGLIEVTRSKSSQLTSIQITQGSGSSTSSHFKYEFWNEGVLLSNKCTLSDLAELNALAQLGKGEQTERQI